MEVSVPLTLHVNIRFHTWLRQSTRSVPMRCPHGFLFLSCCRRALDVGGDTGVTTKNGSGNVYRTSAAPPFPEAPGGPQAPPEVPRSLRRPPMAQRGPRNARKCRSSILLRRAVQSLNDARLVVTTKTQTVAGDGSDGENGPSTCRASGRGGG